MRQVRQKSVRSEPQHDRKTDLSCPTRKRALPAWRTEVVKHSPVQLALPKQQDKRPCAKLSGGLARPFGRRAHAVKRQEKDRIVYKEIEDARIEGNWRV